MERILGGEEFTQYCKSEDCYYFSAIENCRHWNCSHQFSPVGVESDHYFPKVEILKGARLKRIRSWLGIMDEMTSASEDKGVSNLVKGGGGKS